MGDDATPQDNNPSNEDDEKNQTADTQVIKPGDQPEGSTPSDNSKEVDRMSKALANRNASFDKLEKEFEDFKKTQERAQLSKTEQLEAKLQDAQDALTGKNAEIAASAQREQVALRTATLTQLGLINSSPGVVQAFLSGYDSDVDESLEVYTKAKMKDASWAPLFKKDPVKAPATAPPVPGTNQDSRQPPGDAPEMTQEDLAYFLAAGLTEEQAKKYVKKRASHIYDAREGR